MHIVVCGDIAYPTINGVSRISAKGVLHVILNMEGGGGGGGGGGKDFALQLLKFQKYYTVVNSNCKARAIEAIE